MTGIQPFLKIYTKPKRAFEIKQFLYEYYKFNSFYQLIQTRQHPTIAQGRGLRDGEAGDPEAQVRGSRLRHDKGGGDAEGAGGQQVPTVHQDLLREQDQEERHAVGTQVEL